MSLKTLKGKYQALCTPSKFYFALSCVSILALFLQNLSSPNSYKVGTYKIPLQHHNFIFFVIKVVYVVAWTWVLDKLCDKGYKGVSWFLVLLPFIGFFILVGILVMAGLEKTVKRRSN